MAIVANEVRYVVTLDGSKDVSLLSISNKFWNRGIPAHALSPHLRLPPAAGSVSGGGGDVPFRATCPPPPPRSPEAEKANGEMSAAILRGESEAVARLVAEGDVQTDFTNEHGEGWLHLAARAYRGDHAIFLALIPLCDVNARDLVGTNALGAAIAHECDVGLMAALLSEGVDERRCKGERSAMELVLQTYYSRTWSQEYLKLLLDHRPQSGKRCIGVGRDSRPPIHLAIERGDPECVSALLNHPSCALDTDSDRILSDALLSERPSVEVVRVIVEAIETQKGTAELRRHFVYDSLVGPTTAISLLMKARYLRVYQREAAEIIDYLVGKGCPVDGSDGIAEEKYPVHEALSKPRILRQLLLNGCSLAGTRRQSLLHMAMAARSLEPLSVMLLMAFGCRLREGESVPEERERLYHSRAARMPSLMELARTAFLRARVRGHRLAYLEQMEARERSFSGEGDKILLPEAVRSFIRDWDKDIKL